MLLVVDPNQNLVRVSSLLLFISSNIRCDASLKTRLRERFSPHLSRYRTSSCRVCYISHISYIKNYLVITALAGTLKLRLGSLRRQQSESLLQRHALLGKLIIRRKSRRVRRLRRRSIRCRFLRPISRHRQSPSRRTIAFRHPVARSRAPPFPGFPSTRPPFSLSRAYLERVLPLALFIDVIHQVPIARVRSSVFSRPHPSFALRSFHHSFARRRSIRSIQSNLIQSDRIQSNRPHRRSSPSRAFDDAIEFIALRSLEIVHRASSLGNE